LANEEQFAILRQGVEVWNDWGEDDLDRVRNLERQIAQVDAEIDQKVYALYGLRGDEVKVVEGG
jgi:hypothetical protein